MVVKRVGVASCGKIVGAIYGGLGLLVGLVFSLLAVFGVPLFGPEDPGWAPLVLGVGAVVVLPLFYAVMGFVIGIVAAWIFNLASGWTGGLQLEVES